MMSASGFRSRGFSSGALVNFSHAAAPSLLRDKGMSRDKSSLPRSSQASFTPQARAIGRVRDETDVQLGAGEDAPPRAPLSSRRRDPA